MVTVTMWSISIPEDSSVREIEQAAASVSHLHVHISELAQPHRHEDPCIHECKPTQSHTVGVSSNVYFVTKVTLARC